jgi:hypothetical protein
VYARSWGFHNCYYFRPACFKILFSVPLAKSSDGLPAMVTNPFFQDEKIGDDCHLALPESIRRFQLT